jgi:hypothetical protein
MLGLMSTAEEIGDMAKIACKCGNILNLIITPSPDGFKIVSEKTVDSFYEAQVNSPDDIVTKIRLESDSMYKCAVCGRLIVYWKDKNDWPTFYRAESDEPDRKTKV